MLTLNLHLSLSKSRRIRRNVEKSNNYRLLHMAVSKRMVCNVILFETTKSPIPSKKNGFKYFYTTAKKPENISFKAGALVLQCLWAMSENSNRNFYRVP